VTHPESPPTAVDSWIEELAPSIEADAARIVATARTALKLDLSDPRVARALELSALVALKRALAAELAEVGEEDTTAGGYPSPVEPAAGPNSAPAAPRPLGEVFERALSGEPAGGGLSDDAIARIAAAAAEAARQAVLERFRREREAAEARAAVEAARGSEAGEPAP